MFQELANHNAFIKDLEDTGYHIDFIGNHLVIFGVPYLDEECCLQHGDIFSALDLTGWVIDPPSDHQIFFRGGRPHHQSGEPIRLGGGPNPIVIVDGMVADQSFSFKLKGENQEMRPYVSIQEKLLTYLDVITAPAILVFPDATPLRGIEVKAAAQGGPLKIPDTMSARYRINDISSKLEGVSVAIIGLGGTGAYILDLVSKTSVSRIGLFDSDKIHIHTIMRLPGALKKETGKNKVEALATIYGELHGGIEFVSEKIDSTNFDLLDSFHFIFVAIDNADARGAIAEYLVQKDLPFVDCGMGVVRSAGGLNAMMRVTRPTGGNFRDILSSPFLPVTKPKDDEYRAQIQIAEFNAINAALAVVAFKQNFGLYEDLHESAAFIFESCTNEFSFFGKKS